MINPTAIMIMMMLTASLGKTSSMCYHKTSLPPYPIPPSDVLPSLIESTDKSADPISEKLNSF